MELRQVIFCAVIIGCAVGHDFGTDFQPSMIHLSYGDSPSEMIVMWSTQNNTVNTSIVEYGRFSLNTVVNGTSKHFTDDTDQWIHIVRLTDLAPDTKYFYHVGSPLGWSSLYFFKTMPKGESWSPRLAMFGDMGARHSLSLPRLQEDTQEGMYDAIIHAGDFAYDLNSWHGDIGDMFMRQIQAIAAYVPYMTCPGNHDYQHNFSHYKTRFTMPGGNDNMFYSFNMGPAHFVSISTEFYFFIVYGTEQIVNQFKWLEADLAQANEDRHIRPWIIVYGHRPPYCSNIHNDDCRNHNSRIRLGLEQILDDYGVDLVIWAHEHCYERLWPVFDYKVYNGSTKYPYHDPPATVHIITGSAGNVEGQNAFPKINMTWSAFHSKDFGYTRLKVINSTHLYLEQVSDDQNGKVIDEMTLVRTIHGGFKQRREKINKRLKREEERKKKK